MKGIGLLVLWLSVLIGDVRANDNSIAFELLHYYYAYKMNWQAGTKKVLATQCQPSDTDKDTALATAKIDQGIVGICAFDEFVKYIMQKEWVEGYKPDVTTDHVIDPDVAAAKKINAVEAKSVRYNLLALSSDFIARKPIPDVLAYTNTVMQEARKTGKVPQASVDQASKMLTIVQQYRKADVYTFMASDLKVEFPKLVSYFATKTVTIADGAGADGAGTTYTDLDSDQSLANMDVALESKALDDPAQKGLFETFVETYGLTGNYKRKAHMRIIRKAKAVLEDLALTVAVEEVLPECKAA